MRKGENEKPSSHWVTLKMVTMTGARTKPGARFFWVSHVDEGPKVLCNPLLLSQAPEQGTRLAVRHPGHESVPTWDARVSGSKFTDTTTMPAPETQCSINDQSDGNTAVYMCYKTSKVKGRKAAPTSF